MIAFEEDGYERTYIDGEKCENGLMVIKIQWIKETIVGRFIKYLKLSFVFKYVYIVRFRHE